ncbi:hypothetical protein F2Q68_00036747, partial [Brassica cretica]
SKDLFFHGDFKLSIIMSLSRSQILLQLILDLIVFELEIVTSVYFPFLESSFFLFHLSSLVSAIPNIKVQKVFERMAHNGNDEVMASQCASAMVDINIKTLDSQTHTLRVDKCVS